MLLSGGWGDSSVEQALAGAHQAAARDLLEKLTSLAGVDRAIVATDDRSWVATLNHLPVLVDIDPPGECFRFGCRLAGLIERYGVERALYTGGGSAPLLATEQWATVIDRLGQREQTVITNNLHSCDWVGFTSAQEAASWIARQENDNAIAWVLMNEGGFQAEALPASAGSRFDIDTPMDLLIARRHPGIGINLRDWLGQLEWQSPQLDAVVAEMGRKGGSLVVAGRVSPAAWGALQEATQCWIRVFAEERGMRASGRQQRGEVRSLLSDYLDLVGCQRFFEDLGGLANGVLLDNRVILASHGLWPSAPDRFRSDLYWWEQIDDAFLQDLTRAAAQAPVPVILGGHTVVAGGLLALAEAAHAGGSTSMERDQHG